MARLLEASQKFTGTEPNWKGVDPEEIKKDAKMLIVKTLNWYALESSQKEALTWLEKEYPKRKFSYGSTAGFLCRMIQRGFPRELVQDQLDILLTKIPIVAKEKPVVKQPEPVSQFKQVDKNVDTICEMVDYAIDDFLTKKKTDIKIKMSGLNKKQLEEISVYIQKYLTEFSGCSKREGYENITQRLENHIVGFLTQALGQIQSILPQAKERKQRKKKEIPVDRIVKNFTVTDHGKYKTVGADKLHGCSVALLYDSKLRRISVIFAEDGKFLSVKGKAIININETKSFSKLLRKPEIQIDEILKAHKLSITKQMEAVKSVTAPPKFRSSDTTTILKVW